MYCARISALPDLVAALSSHCTDSASRPRFAVQKSFASTATPCGICTTSVTPLIAFALVASKDFTFAPYCGGCATTAVSMPGSFTSMVKTALPFVLAFESLRGTSLPISLKSFGSFNFTSAGTGIAAAFCASCPKLALCSRCATTPRSTVIASAGTFHSFAAAATSIERAAAPALRICSYELAIAELPPVPCASPQLRLL